MSSSNTPFRNTFAFYWSFKDAIRDMSDADKLAIYESITDFAFFGIEPDGLSPIGSLAWKLMRPQLEASIRRYEACIENGKKGAEFGKLGGAPKGNCNAAKTTPKHPLNHNYNDNHNENQNENEKGVIMGKRNAFSPPSLSEVSDYIKEKHYAVDPQRFIDYYTSNGWKVGKNPMRDWKAAVRNWNSKGIEFSNKTTKQGYETTKRTYKDL